MGVVTLFDILKHTSGISVLIPLVCCLIRFKALNSILRVLFVYLLVSVLADMLGLIFMRHNIKTYLIFHSFTVVECSLLVFIYLTQFEQRLTRNIIKISFSFFLLMAIVILVINKGYNRQDSILSSYESIFLILLSIGYFYKVMKELNIPKLNEFYFAWINTGVLIYFITGFLLFLFNGYIEKRGLKTHNTLYSLHWLSNIAYNILLSLGIWKIRQK